MIVAQVLAAVSSINTQSVLLFLLVFLLTVTWISHRRRPRNLPPGPLAWPIIGNARSLLRGQLHHNLADLARQYGSIVRIWLGPRLAIVLSDIDSVKEALIKQADCFSERMRDGEQSGSIIMSNGDVWKERRRFGLSAMRTLGMGKKSVEHKINEEARHLLESFDGEGEKPFDPDHATLNAVSNIICRISFGYRFEYSDPKFAYLIQSVKTILATSSFTRISLLSFFLSLFRKRADETRQRVESVQTFIQDVVKEHQESFDPNDVRDIIDMYIVEIEQQEKGGKSGEHTAFCKTTMWRGIYDLFVAGTDTTTNTLLWLMLYIAINRDVQEKVQKEIDDVIGSDRQPTSEDRNGMPYTNAVLMEIERICPVVPLGVPHKAYYETELLGFTIPANTMVFINHWAILRDPKYWKDPEKFDPTRFLSEDGKTVEKPEAFVPFSLGRRVCMGETLAKMELFLFSVNLLQRFTFSLPAGKPHPSLEGVVGVTLAPIPFELVARKR